MKPSPASFFKAFRRAAGAWLCPAVLAAMAFSGCGTLSRPKQKPAAGAAPEAARRELKKIAEQPGSQKFAEIDRLIAQNKNNELAFEAYLTKARLLLQSGRRQMACKAYEAAAGRPFSHKNQSRAVFPAAECLRKKGKALEAVRLLDSLAEDPRESRKIKAEAARLQWGLLKKKKGLKARKLKALSLLVHWEPKAPEASKRLKAGEDLIDSLARQSLLALAAAADKYPPFKGFLFYRAGQSLWREKNVKLASDYFRRALAGDLRDSLKKEISGYLKILRSLKKVNPYLIGAVLPLSGRRRALGQRVLRGLHLGLNMEGDSPWQIIVMDSKGHPDAAAEALKKLLYQYHVIGVAGGLSSQTAEAIAGQASFFGLPAVLFSQRSGLTKDRKFVFQNAIPSSALMSVLTEETEKNLPLLKRAAILRPEDPYGEEYAKAFSKAFQERGGEITASLSYKPGEADFKIPIKKLLGLHDLKARQEEYEALKAALLEKKPDLPARSKKLRPENLLPPKIEFDAVFIPDSMAAMKKIKAHLKYFRVRDIYLLGTNLLKRRQAGRWTESLPLVFAGDPPLTNKEAGESSFYEGYKKIFRASPGLFERRAYNSGAAIKAALSRNLKTRRELQEALESLGKVQGAFYPFEISKERSFVYPLQVYITSEKKVLPLDSLPPAKRLQSPER